MEKEEDARSRLFSTQSGQSFLSDLNEAFSRLSISDGVGVMGTLYTSMSSQY